MKNKKIVMTIVAILVLLISVIGFSYAFFEAQSGTPVVTDVRATMHTVDTLTLSVDEDIHITATQLNFTNGGDNQDGEATATAILTPNSKTGAATKHYYLYLNLTSNETVYSRANTNHDPELLLQVFDSSDNLVTLTGLGAQKTIDGLTGYDITGKSGLMELLSNHEITASNSLTTTQEWRIVVTFINLDVNQNDNTDKHIRGTLIIRETEMTYCEAYPTESICGIVNLSSNTTTLTNGYLYYHGSTLENGANDGSYRYAGTNPNNYICFGSDASTCPANNIYRIIGLIPVDVVTDAATSPVTTKRQMLYKIIRNDPVTGSEITINNGTYNGGAEVTGSDGVVLNNIQGFHWGNSELSCSNTWSESTLNTIGLNTEFLTSFGNTWQNRIANVMWKVGGVDWNNIGNVSPVSTIYTNEITNSGVNATVAPSDNKNELPNKIGLMYISDYGYSAQQSEWTKKVSYDSGNGYYYINNNYSTVVRINWLHRGITQWTITRNSTNSISSFHTSMGGAVYHGETCYGTGASAFAVRPTFYLTKNTVIDMTNHAGTLADPYRIS